MARLNVEELVGGLLEAAMVSQGISERQHIMLSETISMKMVHPKLLPLM